MGQRSNKQKPLKSPRNTRPETDPAPTVQETPRTVTPRPGIKGLRPGTKKVGESENFSLKKLEKLFEKYKDPDSEDITPVGAMSFIKDLDLTPTDVVLLIIAWHLNAKQMGIFTKEEFVGGFKRLGLDSVEKIKAKLDSFREELNDKEKLNLIYRFSFDFYKDQKEKKNYRFRVGGFNVTDTYT